MSDIEHTLQDDPEAEVEIDSEIGHGFFIGLRGNGSSIKCYVDYEHMQALVDALYSYGVRPNWCQCTEDDCNG